MTYVFTYKASESITILRATYISLFLFSHFIALFSLPLFYKIYMSELIMPNISSLSDFVLRILKKIQNNWKFNS